MKDNLLSIEQASNRLRETLIKYIEATYHISDEYIIDQRNNLLNSPNVIHNSPYIESTPQLLKVVSYYFYTKQQLKTHEIIQ